MKKTLIVTLEVDVEDLDDTERREANDVLGEPLEELPDLSAVRPDELAGLIVGEIENPSGDSPFAGSDIFAKFTGARVRSATFEEPSAATSGERADAPLIYPSTLTPELRAALSTMCFHVIQEAHLLRAAGYDIKTRAEDEQAFFVDQYVRAVIVAGPRWREHVYDTLIAPAIEKVKTAKAEREAKPPSPGAVEPSKG